MVRKQKLHNKYKTEKSVVYIRLCLNVSMSDEKVKGLWLVNWNEWVHRTSIAIKEPLERFRII